MAEKYKKKKETGNEYVKAVIELYDYAMTLREKLPKIWEKDITDNLMTSAKKIMENSLTANAVYMKETNLDKKVKSYQTRIEYLSIALREFSVFDMWFAALVKKVDLEKSEAVRLTSIICQIIQDSGGQVVKAYKPAGKSNPAYVPLTEEETKEKMKAWMKYVNDCLKNGKELDIDNMQSIEFVPFIQQVAKDNGKVENVALFPKPYTQVEIAFLNRPYDLTFEASNGCTYVLSKVFTLGNREHLALLETTAKDLVAERLSRDRSQLGVLIKRHSN